MKKTMIRIIIAVIAVVLVGLMVMQLRKNKSEVEYNVAFAQQTVQKIPVTVEKASRGILDENLKVTGVLEAAQSVMVMSETQGKIISIYKEKGDKVRKGDVIVKVDDEVIAANVLTAEANYEQYQKDVERLKRLSKENAVTKRDLEQTQIGLKKAKADLINAQKALSNTAIKAPISGYINNDFLSVGQLLGGGGQVCEIVDNSSLIVNVSVSEKQAYKVFKGKEVNVYISVFPDKVFTGIVSAVAEKAGDGFKFNVEVELENNMKPSLKSGLYAEVEIPVTNEENILISKSAIIGSMEKPEIFVVENNKAIKRELIVGQGDNNKIEVLRGLSGKEQIIVSGQLNLTEGDEVTVVN